MNWMSDLHEVITLQTLKLRIANIPIFADMHVFQRGHG